MLNEEIKEYIDKSVLCWLATSSKQNNPNVSPKEAFMAYGNDHIIIANIASPQTVKNIKENENVCISFVDVFVQKGFQLKGKAKILTNKDDDYESMKKCLEEFLQGKYPFPSITKIRIDQVKRIVAPSYRLFPELTEEEQIASAKKTYGVQ